MYVERKIDIQKIRTIVAQQTSACCIEHTNGQTCKLIVKFFNVFGIRCWHKNRKRKTVKQGEQENIALRHELRIIDKRQIFHPKFIHSANRKSQHHDTEVYLVTFYLTVLPPETMPKSHCCLNNGEIQTFRLVLSRQWSLRHWAANSPTARTHT